MRTGRHQQKNEIPIRGKKEDWKFDASNPGAGLFEADVVEDSDKDLVMWNGSWIRGVRFRRRR